MRHMRHIFETFEVEIKTLEENLDFLVSSKKDVKHLIKELYASVLNLREEFPYYIYELALYKEKHIDKNGIYRKKIEDDYIEERLFLDSAIQKAKKEFGKEKFEELCEASEKLCMSYDLEICVFKVFDEISSEFDALVSKCEEALKNK